MAANPNSLRERILHPGILNALQLDRRYGALDLALVVTGILLALTRATIILFHVIFILLTIGAFLWKLRPFVIRACIWVTFASVVVLHHVLVGDTPVGELVELPLLTIIFLLVFAIARQRATAEEALRKTNDELEIHVAERTRKLTEVNAELIEEIDRHRQTGDTLRESEERYRRLVELSFEAVAIHSNGVFVYINPAGAALLGATDAKELVGKPVRDFVHPDYWELVQERIEYTETGGAGAPLVEEKLIRLNGTSVEVETAAVPITYNGQPAVQVVFRDLTARREAELERQQERTRIARDLHDSLGHSLGYLHLKLDQLAAPQAGDDPVALRREMIKMRDVANDAYEMVRGMLAALLPSNSADVTTALLVRARKAGKRGGFKVVLTTAGQPKVLHPVVQQRILFLFQEALNNVEKHARAQSVNLDLSWTADTLTIAMSDDGQGFDVNTLQVNGHHGLRIMQERAEEMNGQLSVNSYPPSGTEVVLRLGLHPIAQRVTA